MDLFPSCRHYADPSYTVSPVNTTEWLIPTSQPCQLLRLTHPAPTRSHTQHRRYQQTQPFAKHLFSQQVNCITKCVTRLHSKCYQMSLHLKLKGGPRCRSYETCFSVCLYRASSEVPALANLRMLGATLQTRAAKCRKVTIGYGVQSSQTD